MLFFKAIIALSLSCVLNLSTEQFHYFFFNIATAT